jgi:hypothetical protein
MAVLRASHGGVIASSFPPGVAEYQYMFRTLADDDASSRPAGLSDAEYLECLQALGNALTFTTGNCQFALPRTNLSRLPPAHTYFGQFIDHDMTAPIFAARPRKPTREPDTEYRLSDKVLLDELQQTRRPKSSAAVLKRVKNFWVEPLNLQSLYGGGPDDEDPDIRAMYTGGSLRLVKAAHWTNAKLRQEGLKPDLIAKIDGFDIPRRSKEPLLADHRNDENLILSQMHCRMICFHNRVLAALGGGKRNFEEARALVTRFYHWIILRDFLPRLLDREVLRQVVEEAQTGPLLAKRRVPVEFTAAAYRFGHSMIRQCYDYNRNFGKESSFGLMAELGMLFMFSSKGRLASGEALPSHWVAEWQRMVRPSDQLFFSSAIDSFIANTMNELHRPHGAPMYFRHIGTRNLMRGFMRRVPSGQKLARAMGHDPLPATALRLSDAHLESLEARDRELIAESKYTSRTPAWYYFLCEAKAKHNGQRLGPVASDIIARTIIGLMQRHPVNILDGNWRPAKEKSIRARDGGPVNTLEDLLMCEG